MTELLAMPEEDRYELVAGELIPKEAAKGKHGAAQTAIGHLLFRYNRRGGPPDQPGGWRFASEVLVEFGPHQIRRPDVAGWRRIRLAEWPDTAPITVTPDWICEVLSSNRGTDLVVKMSLYHQALVPHYWVLDPEAETLSVYRWTQQGYLHVGGAQRADRIRAEPFDAIELPVGVFFGDDEEVPETP